MSDSLIVLLAGGDAFRYGQSLKDPNNSQPDKLLSSHGNTNLLRYVTDELRVLGNLVLVTRGEKRRSCYCTLLNSNNHHQPIAVIREDQRNSIGPLGGIYAALQYYPDIQTRLILPADLPNVRREVISEILMKASQLKHFDIISIVHPNGQVENLLLVMHGGCTRVIIMKILKATDDLFASLRQNNACVNIITYNEQRTRFKYILEKVNECTHLEEYITPY